MHPVLTENDYPVLHVSDMAIETLEEIRKSSPSLPSSPHTHRKNLSRLEALGVFVTDRVGTMGFFFVIFGWTILWLSWNTLAPKQVRFDPAPAFVRWLFISNLIQIHLMPLIMVGQMFRINTRQLAHNTIMKLTKKLNGK